MQTIKTEKNQEETNQQQQEKEIGVDLSQAGSNGIDYEKLIREFGCSEITPTQIERIERLTQMKAHRFLRRKIFFSHRELDYALESYESGKPFYLYTGRGPSSESLHLGHLLPFVFTAYLQKAFKVPLVIQITDDEKFFYNETGLSLETFSEYGIENCKDILACGFDPDLTFILNDTSYIGGEFYKNMVRIQKHVNFNQLKGIFGVNESSNCGRIVFPCIQAAPSFSNSFPHLFGSRTDIPCLIPQGIDQDPYFRMTRDVAPKLKYLKPACIHSKFFPSLLGPQGKMSSSDPNSAIFLTDSADQIREKITKYAYSGGGKTLKEHKELGANLNVDVAYQYLFFFLEDDQKIREIEENYRNGEMSTKEVKDILINLLQDIVQQHQEKRAKITTKDVLECMKPRKLNF